MRRGVVTLGATATVVATLSCAALATPSLSAQSPRSIYATTALPAATGLGLAHNDDAEPSAAVDGDGKIWVAADIAISTSLSHPSPDPRATTELSGADIWTSSDDGRSFRWVADPFAALPGRPGLGGLDTDIAVAPERNSDGFYNVYVVSNWIGSSSAAISTDGGRSWIVRQLNGLPEEDRPWVTADGPCGFYVTYHTLAPYDTVVDRYSICDFRDVAIGSAIDPVHSTEFALSSVAASSNRHGKPVVDSSPASTHQHNLYVPMLVCYLPSASDQVANALATANNSLSCSGPSEVFI